MRNRIYMTENMETTPKTAIEWIEYCARELIRSNVFFGHGTENAWDEAAWLVLHVIGAPLDGSFLEWERVLNPDQVRFLEDLLARRIHERIPLAYLTGEARFCDLDFFVTPDVLVPRSPTAELIREQFSPWLKAGQTGKVMDMCTGGGCIAVAMAMHMPDVEVDAVDDSAAALKVAKRNIERHAVGSRVRLIKSDLFSKVTGARYDLIVSNPPYVSAEAFAQLPPEYLAEPASGLVCGEDGLDIVLQILAVATGYLQSKGVLVMEVGESAAGLVKLLPRLPFLWLDFSNGGDGVFLLEYDQLILCRSDVLAALELRQNV